MKKKTKIIIALAVAASGTLILGACGDLSRYPEYAEEGYKITICYDANGGNIAGRANSRIVDTYHIDVAKKGIKLIAPDDFEHRDDMPVDRMGYFLTGWYETRELRTDDSGQPVDEYGVLCSESGREQGYIYSGLWDFENDIYTFEGDDYEYEQGTYTKTLYAGWIPEFAYEAYGENEKGEWELLGSYSYNPLLVDGSTLAVPQWDEKTGAMDYGNFPSPRNKTFLKAYSDSAKTIPTEVFENHGEYDVETGVSKNSVTKCYVDWREGTWFRITKAEQFIDHFTMNGCYEIGADLDFGELSWNFGASTFGGTILGNGHKFRNITVQQTNMNDNRGGIFGSLNENAVLQNVGFENAVYNLEAASRIQGAEFGFLTGHLSEQAKLENVTLDGEFRIGKDVYLPRRGEGYTLGIISGNLLSGGISAENVRLVPDETFTASLNEATGEITIAYA